MLATFLKEEGLIPSDCSKVELLMPASGAIALRYEVFVQPDDLPKLARVLTRLAASENSEKSADPSHEAVT